MRGCVRVAVASAVDVSAIGVTGNGGSLGPTEHIQTGDFSSSTGWSGAAWTIALGVATCNSAGQFFVNALAVPIDSGADVSGSIDVIDNPAGAPLSVFLYNTSTLASQTIINELGGVPGTFTGNVTASSSFDAVWIRSIGDAGIVIDNVSATTP